MGSLPLDAAVECSWLDTDHCNENSSLIAGMVSAIDINGGRLRILRETAKLHQVNDVITTICADLRNFAVSYIFLSQYEEASSESSLTCNFCLSRKAAHNNLTKFCWMLHVLVWVFCQR